MLLNQSSIRLIEQGPRLTLQLFKIEEGFLNGEVLYHKNIIKTEEEKAAILQRRLEKRCLKEARKKEQEERKKIKELAKQKLKEKSIQGQKNNKKTKKLIKMNNVNNGFISNGDNFDDEDNNDEDDENDAAWFKAEVGKDPDSDLFSSQSKGIKRKKLGSDYFKKGKKSKLNYKSKQLKKT